MIARIWRGVTSESDKDLFRVSASYRLEGICRLPGNQGVWVLRRVSGGEAEFTLISLWESWDAIKAFAGPDHERAVYYPEDKRFLLHLDPEVRHYEVLSSPLG